MRLNKKSLDKTKKMSEGTNRSQPEQQHKYSNKLNYTTHNMKEHNEIG